MNNLNELNTGDILLFCGHKTGPLTCFSKLIQCCTHSSYSHVAVVLKDPDFIDPPLKGLYVWESGWECKPDPQDGKIKLGVQITPLEEVMEDFSNSIILYRKLISPSSLITREKLKEIHNVVYDKPYDIVPKDWIEALLKKDPDPQKINRFWCSALTGYIYTKLGILKSDTDWTIMRPSDFSLDAENLNYINNCLLYRTETRIQ